MDLSDIALFKDFSPEELENFLPIIQTLTLTAGDILFNDGEPGDSLYIIKSGSIRIFKVIDSEAGTEKSLALLEAGTFLGEMSLIEGSTRSASARAEIDSTILKITRSDFLKLLRSYPKAAIRLFISFVNVVSARLRRTNEELIVLYEVGKIISTAPPLEDLLAGILKPTINACKVRIAMAFALNEFSNKLENVCTVSDDDTSHLNGLKIKSDSGIIAQSLTRNEILSIHDFTTNPEYAAVERFGFESDRMLVVPLTRRDLPFGAIILIDRTDGEPFDNANINLIGAVASQAAAAIESAFYHKDRDAREQFDRKYLAF